MRAVIQRVSNAYVKVEEDVLGSIKRGLVVLIGISENDSETDLDWLLKKIVNMRIFSDENGKFNHSLIDENAMMLVISQFTLLANCKKGNRPSFILAAKAEKAEAMYNLFVKKANALILPEVQCGKFAADMKVHLVNDGPVTITLDSNDK